MSDIKYEYFCDPNNFFDMKRSVQYNFSYKKFLIIFIKNNGYQNLIKFINELKNLYNLDILCELKHYSFFLFNIINTLITDVSNFVESHKFVGTILLLGNLYIDVAIIENKEKSDLLELSELSNMLTILNNIEKNRDIINYLELLNKVEKLANIKKEIFDSEISNMMMMSDSLFIKCCNNPETFSTFTKLNSKDFDYFKFVEHFLENKNVMDLFQFMKNAYNYYDFTYEFDTNVFNCAIILTIEELLKIENKKNSKDFISTINRLLNYFIEINLSDDKRREIYKFKTNKMAINTIGNFDHLKINKKNLKKLKNSSFFNTLNFFDKKYDTKSNESFYLSDFEIYK